MHDGHPKVRLETGATFVVPRGIDLQPANQRQPRPTDTPVVQPYVTKVFTHGRYFQFPEDFIEHGFIIFMPEVTVGDKLRLLWADPTCACAVKAEDYDRLMVGVSQELAPASG